MKTELNRTGAMTVGRRFAIVVSRWNDGYTSRLKAGAMRALEGAAKIDVYGVPGAFELPLASLKAASSRRYDAVIALGVVIKGDTPHFDYVAGETAAGLMRASLETRVPVLFGVITADTTEQAEARCGEGEDNKGWEAAVSAVEFISDLRAIEGDEVPF